MAALAPHLVDEILEEIFRRLRRPPAPHFVDEILEEIFLRLPTPAALARASTACPRFRRIITDRPFLRKYRKRHPPPLLGLLVRKGGFYPVQAPDPSAPLARSLADAADFTYSFLPDSEYHWTSCDARDGRVLLVEEIRNYAAGVSFTNLAVCDPLSRRCVLLPPIPKEMAAQEELYVHFEYRLTPIGADEDRTSFKVVCTASYMTKLVVFVFSSVTGQWCAASTSWSSLVGRLTYIRGCLYWTDRLWVKLLVLDMSIMEFSTVEVLTGYNVQLRNQPGRTVCMYTIVDGTKGAPEMLTLDCDNSLDSFYLYHTTQQNNGESSSEWQLKNVMELPRQCRYSIVGVTEGFLFLRGIQEDQVVGDGHAWSPKNFQFFSLEVKTFELKKLCMAAIKESDCVHLYFSFPPSLSEPSL